MTNPRYDGKPLLRLVEYWVLWSIDEIEPNEVSLLVEMEPNLRTAWSLEGSWHSMLEQLLELSPALQDELRGMWKRNLETARENNMPAPKEMFAQSIADQIAG
ncbi:hypothetical protein SH528x_004498 [Novipirellula sp. SH528]|uniref:hypothetical protein n=1 Tax=Novipirellula sp. SH528 TaxID=3454466 RepID=UPI003F9F2A4E